MAEPNRSSVPSAGRNTPESEPPPDDAHDKAAEAPRDTPEPTVSDDDTRGGLLRVGIVNVKMIYASYLVAPAIPVAALFGGFFAHRGTQSGPPAWLMTHYRYQLRTFAIGVVANLLAWVLALAGIGLLLFPLIAMWVVVRSVNGLIRVARREAIENPESWLI